MFDKGTYLKCMFLHWLILPCGQVALNILYDDYEEGFDIDQTTMDRESHEILDILRQNETFAGWIEKVLQFSWEEIKHSRRLEGNAKDSFKLLKNYVARKLLNSR